MVIMIRAMTLSGHQMMISNESCDFILQMGWEGGAHGCQQYQQHHCSGPSGEHCALQSRCPKLHSCNNSTYVLKICMYECVYQHDLVLTNIPAVYPATYVSVRGCYNHCSV